MAELRVVDDFPLQKCETCGYTWMSDDVVCPRCVFEPAEAWRAILIDWSEFWRREQATEEWLVWPLVPNGRGVALYAPAKAGKSLVVLALVAAACTGRVGLDGLQRPPVRVLYLDYEMTLDDLQERLEAMGYGPDSDLSHLFYASLPSLPPLNTPEGAKAILELAQGVEAQLVVIDTFGRSVEGEENSNDVAQDFYRWTGLSLKASGIAYLRTDHAGKDAAKGQRGGSAKNDDVDVVWRLERQQGGVVVKATHRRISWVPETVQIRVDDTDGWELSVAHDATYPAGTKEVADLLDSLKVDIDASYNTANRLIRSTDAEGKGRQKGLVLAAQRFRREAILAVINGSERPPNGSGNRSARFRPEPVSGTVPQNSSHAGAEPVPEPVGTSAADTTGTGPPPLGGTGPKSHPDDYNEVPF